MNVLNVLNLSSKDDTVSKLAVNSMLKELMGTLFLVLFFFPPGMYLGDTYVSYVVHFVSVFVFDFVTFGCGANPAVCLGLYITGHVSFINALSMIVGQLLAANYAFSILKTFVTPFNLADSIGGPSLGSGYDIKSGFAAEFILSFIFMIVVLYVTAFVKNINVARGVFASSLRLLMSSPARYVTGACFNPMIAIAWMAYLKGSNSNINNVFSNSDDKMDYVLIYCVAPCMGTCVAALLWAASTSPTAATEVQKKATTSAPEVRGVVEEEEEEEGEEEIKPAKKPARRSRKSE